MSPTSSRRSTAAAAILLVALLRAPHALAEDPSAGPPAEEAKAADTVRSARRLSPQLTIARLQQQLAAASPQTRQRLSEISAALRRAGLPE